VPSIVTNASIAAPATMMNSDEGDKQLHQGEAGRPQSAKEAPHFVPAQ